jgi:hypothetical protein
MRLFDVQSIEIRAHRNEVFDFVRGPENLPRWARAFASAGNGRARLETPNGTVDVVLDVSAVAAAGTVDWRLVSGRRRGRRAIPRDRDNARNVHLQLRSARTPVAPEQIEGALEAQSRTLRAELTTLKELMEA